MSTLHWPGLDRPHRSAISLLAANDNCGDRRVRFVSRVPEVVSIAEVEVFGTFLSELEADNDNINVDVCV